MVKRKHLALIFDNNDNWIGGTYYIINIVRALKELPYSDKPEIKVYHQGNLSDSQLAMFDYPFINFEKFEVKSSLMFRLANRIWREIFGKTLFKTKIGCNNIANLYPVPDWINLSNVANYYYWIPDFQERYLPHFFSKKELRQRRIFQETLFRKNEPIVFSSQSALKDFDTFFPKNLNKKLVLSFASSISKDYLNINLEEVLAKHGISGNYFMCPNQFWVHKNHKVVLEALKILKDLNVYEQVVFTGKQFDHRNPHYFDGLLKYIENNDLTDRVKFLGFIDRDEQLKLMKNAVAVIQPSLFEGWSTVVEDVKAIGQRIILSDIPIHREQITENVLFFNPESARDLADQMLVVRERAPKDTSIAYEINKEIFARKILEILN